jgi:quinol monooxygenase YgiN
MSVVVTAAFVPAPGTRDQLVAALSAFVTRVHEEDGCELFALHENADGGLLLIEKWASAEALAAHDAGAPVADIVAALTGLVAEPPVVTRFAPLPLGGADQGRL